MKGNFIRSPLLLDDVIALSSEDSHQGALQSACEPILSEECPLGSTSSEVPQLPATDPVLSQDCRPGSVGTKTPLPSAKDTVLLEDCQQGSTDSEVPQPPATDQVPSDNCQPLEPASSKRKLGKLERANKRARFDSGCPVS